MAITPQVPPPIVGFNRGHHTCSYPSNSAKTKNKSECIIVPGTEGTNLSEDVQRAEKLARFIHLILRDKNTAGKDTIDVV